MHPLELDEETCNQVFQKEGFRIENFSTGVGDILSTYGHGPYCMNYWLRK